LVKFEDFFHDHSLDNRLIPKDALCHSTSASSIDLRGVLECKNLISDVFAFCWDTVKTSNQIDQFSNIAQGFSSDTEAFSHWLVRVAGTYGDCSVLESMECTALPDTVENPSVMGLNNSYAGG